MTVDSEFYTFYDAIINSFEEKKAPSLDQNLISLLDSKDQLSEASFDASQAKIMISSWMDFLNNLFNSHSTEKLLSNLNSHIEFIKGLETSNRQSHLRLFKRICEHLFYFLISNRVIVQNTFEIEDDYRNYLFNLQMFRLKNNIKEVIFSILANEVNLINETTETHIELLLQNIMLNNREQVSLHGNELNAIQETIITILQLDNKDLQSPVVRKLKKEFELVNVFFSLVRELSDNRLYQNTGVLLDGFRIAYEYPFLDVLKTLSKWYQTAEDEHLAGAAKLLQFVKSQNPFRREDILFTNNLEILIHLSYESQIIKQNQLDSILRDLYQLMLSLNTKYTENPVILFIDKFLIYYEDMLKSIDNCLEFFFGQLVHPTITLLYKRKLFIYLVLIVKAWINNGLISGERAHRFSTDLVQIKGRLQKQNLKKMGKFKPIDFKLEPDQIFDEFEKGLSTQLLYALEDFNDWTEGKQMRKKLLQSTLRSEARFQITELIYKIAQQITKDSYDNSASEDLDEIQREMIKSYLREIIEYQFKLIPELKQIFYGAFTIHIMNLTSETAKLNEDDRSDFIRKLSEYEKQQYKRLTIPLLNYADSRVFSEDYEKEFSSLVNIFHLSVPIHYL
jgi:hypothetical protein